MKEEIIEEVIDFIRTKVIYDNDPTLNADAEIWAGGYIDSMGVIRLITHLQQKYELDQIDYTDINHLNFKSPATIADLVMKYHAEKEGVKTA